MNATTDWQFILDINWRKVINNISAEPDEKLTRLVEAFDEPKGADDGEQRQHELFSTWAQGWHEMSLGDIDLPRNDSDFRRQRMFELIVAGVAKAEHFRRSLKG